jgi:hypothetical protein
MRDKNFFNIWVKSIFSVDELKKRLQKKALKLKEGQSAQFFINGEPRYLYKKDNKFMILKNPV